MTRRLITALIAALHLAGAAHAGEWPRSISHEAGELQLDRQPTRIVSTSPSLTGILLAINAPVAATAAAPVGPMTDANGFFSQWAGAANQRGVDVLYPNLAFDIEALMLQNPDLIVASANGGDSIMPYIGELQAQGMPVILLDYSRQGWTELANLLGRATGHEADASAAIADFSRQAGAARARIAHPPGSVSIVAYDFAGTYSVSKPGSAQARVLAELGFEVSGIPETMRGDVSRSADFDFISHENLAAAITGDSVFLLNGTDDLVERFRADPVLANLPAVKAGRVYPLGPHSFRVDYYSGLEIIGIVQTHLAK